MVWIKFAVSAALIVLTATQLAKYGDIIAVRTRLGGMFIGVLLMAGATSLPEVLTSYNAIRLNTPNLAAGDLLGSNNMNMVLLAIIDMVTINQRILRKAALKHALTGSLAVFMIGLVLFFMMADIDIKIGWIGIDGLLIITFYIISVRLIQSNADHGGGHSNQVDEIEDEIPSLRTGIIGFLISAGALVVISPYMVQSANEIAVITGLGTTFIGTTLVALTTSLPEAVTTLAAIKIGANDMAVGNLFGSNMFNMFVIGLNDAFFTQGRFLSVIDPSLMLVGMIGILMTGMGLIGNLAKLEKRIWFIEIDALALLFLFFGSLWLLYTKSVAH
jgi:cation:H+ antiporter